MNSQQIVSMLNKKLNKFKTQFNYLHKSKKILKQAISHLRNFNKKLRLKQNTKLLCYKTIWNQRQFKKISLELIKQNFIKKNKSLSKLMKNSMKLKLNKNKSNKKYFFQPHRFKNNTMQKLFKINQTNLN